MRPMLMRDVRLLGKGRLSPAMQLTGWLMRVALGGTFIFSGFTKAVDPYGTLYRLADYAAAFGVDAAGTALTAAAFLLAAAEFVLGVMIVCGCFRRVSAVAASLVMLVMLPLTLWLALTDPVPDCGCFGDAITISNWGTFWKNVGLAAACVWLLMFNRRIHWLITPALQWIGLVATAAYILYVSGVGYNFQPVADYRDYPEGTVLASADDSAAEEPPIELVYASPDGSERRFSLDDELPDEDGGWRFLRREEGRPNKAGPDVRSGGFSIWDADTGDDVTAAALSGSGYELVALMPRLADVTLRDSWPLNSLYAWSASHNVRMIAVAAADTDEIEAWRDISLAEYPIFSAEDTSIKEVARGNPAIVLLRDGRIVRKATLGSLDVGALTDGESADTTLARLYMEPPLEVAAARHIWMTLMAALVFLSFIPVVIRLVRWWYLRRRRRRAARRAPDQAPPSERRP